MAWATGVAADYIDFLRMLKGYALGTYDPAGSPNHGFTGGIIVPSGDRWTAPALGGGMTALPATGSATDGELYLVGPGYNSPQDQITVGFKTYRNVGANIYGWEIKGFTAYSSALTFTTLPGASPSCFTAMIDTSFNCYFWVNARRIMALARIGTTNILIHVGFVQQFGTRSQYPYPLMISGSILDGVKSYQTNNYGHSCMPDPCGNGCQLRWVDGVWKTYQNYSNSDPNRGQARDVTGTCVWPLISPMRLNASLIGECDTTDNEDYLFRSFQVNSTDIMSSSETGVHALWPTVLMDGDADSIAGRVDGLFVVPSVGISTTDTLTDSTVSPQKVYDVFQNTWRSEVVDSFAVLRA